MKASHADLALAHLNLDVRDLVAAARFYGEVLALPIERRDASLSIRHPQFLLVLARGEPRVGGTFHFGFRVPTRDDVDAWVERVRTMGSPVLIEPRLTRSVYVARIADPDAYEIEIYADVVDDAALESRPP